MLIIGICGKLGSGKDYIATNHVIPMLKSLGIPFAHHCFADQIKVNAMVHQGIQSDLLLEKKTNETRKLLQKTGTELGRDVYGQDIWIRYFDAWTKIYEHRDIKVIITTDVRFKNEVEYIMRRNGILIKVDSPERHEIRLKQETGDNYDAYDVIKKHRSECELDGCESYHFVVNNDVDEHFQADNGVLYFKKWLFTELKNKLFI